MSEKRSLQPIEGEGKDPQAVGWVFVCVPGYTAGLLALREID